ncbi:putative nuclease HARBI1 isoform X2 [Engystomops pustulosus]|uniref:putative nuclease HARBI1 isoform X2 n=1 Tax=Engystomops pustulosus TaxID=76066 RepID=UPI003AFB7E20
MEAFAPVMLYLLQVEEDEKQEKLNPKQRRHLRPSPSSLKPQPKPKQSQKPQVLGIRRPRIFRERTGMEGLTDEEVVERFRLTKRTIVDLYELIRVDIDPLTQRSHAIPGIVKLLNCLHFFSTGSFQTKASAIGGVSQSTFSRFLVPVIQALKKHVHTFIGFPSNKEEWHQLKNGFYSVAGIPNVLGVLDCIHIALSAPHEREEIYRNKEGFHSVNVQMIVDSNCKILSLFSAFPGSSQNSSILRQSSVYEGFESGRLGGGWLLDSAIDVIQHQLIETPTCPNTVLPPHTVMDCSNDLPIHEGQPVHIVMLIDLTLTSRYSHWTHPVTSLYSNGNGLNLVTSPFSKGSKTVRVTTLSNKMDLVQNVLLIFLSLINDTFQ